MTDTGVAIDVSASPGRGAFRMFLRNKAAVVGAVIFLGIAFMTIFGPSLYGVDARKMVVRPFLGPSEADGPMMGSDYLGRDILAGFIGGGRTTLAVAAVAAAMSVVIGLLVGSIAGYYGRWIDAALMRLTELFQTLPTLLFAMVLVTISAPSSPMPCPRCWWRPPSPWAWPSCSRRASPSSGSATRRPSAGVR